MTGSPLRTLCAVAVLTVAPGALCADTANGVAAPRYVFITSSTGSADFSTWADTDADGLTGADEICRARALAESLDNGASYRAWISTGATDAYCHLFGLAGEKATGCGGANPDASLMGPWLRMDGTPFAGTLAEMAGPAHAVYQPVLFDESGSPLADVEFWAWTGTNENGVEGGGNCSDWSSTSNSLLGSTGVAWSVGSDWTSFVSLYCDNATPYIRLYCFEPGAGVPHQLKGSSGALAFVTSVKGNGDLNSWPDAGGASGIDAGDAICQARAAAAYLPNPDSFVAWLSDSAVDARDRVTVDGPIVRVDGFLFAPTKSELQTSSPDLRTGLNVTEFETYYIEAGSPSYIWTGTESDGRAGVNTCDNWGSSLGTDLGVAGSSATVRFTWTVNGSPHCQTERPIYCFSNVALLAWDNFERGDTSRWSLAVP